MEAVELATQISRSRGARAGEATTWPERSPRENSRLTAMMGSLLLVMLAVEGVTVLNVRGMLSLHVFVGVALIAPVVVKIGSTAYRFARYYSHDPAYVTSGPPPPLLRLLGPLVIASTVTLLGSGVGLIIVGHHNDLLLNLHKASLVVWTVVTGVHVLGHLLSLPRLLRGRGAHAAMSAAAPVGGRPRTRLAVAVTVAVVVIGLLAGALSLPAARGYRAGRGSRFDDGARPAMAATAVARIAGPAAEVGRRRAQGQVAAGSRLSRR